MEEWNMGLSFTPGRFCKEVGPQRARPVCKKKKRERERKKKEFSQTEKMDHSNRYLKYTVGVRFYFIESFMSTSPSEIGLSFYFLTLFVFQTSVKLAS